MESGCDSFLTNDSDHKRVAGLRVIFLGDLAV